MDLVALSNGLHGSVQMDSVALFSWIGWLRHHGIFTFNDTKVKMKIIELKRNGDNMKTDIFGMMFFKMSQKHTKRIMGYEATRPFWHFFDLKAYIIMACMMGGGIGFRAA